MSDDTTRRRLRCLIAALLAAAPIVAAQAQERDLDREPSTGKVVRGEIGADGAPATFALSLAAGQAYDLSAAPVAGSDPYLKVYDAASDALIAENDDSAGTLAASVRLYSPSARKVRIEVSNAAESQSAMRFDLILSASDYRPKPARDIALGGEAAGTLESGDEQLFRFRGERGQTWDFALRAAPGSELDPAMEVFAGEVAGGQALGQDDDGGGGLNARLRFTATQSGIYTLRTYGIGATAGAYTLAAGRPATSQAAELQDIGLERAARGNLDEATRERFYRLSESARRTLAGSPGPLIVELRHLGSSEEALDPVVELGFETPLGFSSLLSDDDGAGDSDARLVLDTSTLTPVWLEALRIKAGAFLETSGDYELLVNVEPGE